MTEKLLAIFFSLLILVQAGVIRRIVGTWIFPACLFSLFWFAYTFVPLVVLFWIPVEPLSVGFILLCCTAFSSSSVLFRWRRAFARNRQNTFRFNTNHGSPFLHIAFYGTTLLALAFMAINTLLQGFSFQQIAFNLMETSSEYMAKRYTDTLTTNAFGQMSVVLTYTAATIGGTLYADRNKNSAGIGIVLLSLTPSVLVMLIQAAKGMLFLSIVFFVAGGMICKLRKDDLRLIRKFALRRILFYSAIFTPIVISSFMSRGLYESSDLDHIAKELIRYFASYTAAHLYAFSDWFSYISGDKSTINYSAEAQGFGFYTFMSLFKLLGSDKVVPAGVYTEYYYYADMLQTNIFTIFRGLIIDFGLMGSVLFMVASGFLLHLSFWKLLVNNRSVVHASIFVHSMGIYYTSFIISLLIWNSIYGSFLLVTLLLHINNKLNDRKRRPAPRPDSTQLPRPLQTPSR